MVDINYADPELKAIVGVEGNNVCNDCNKKYPQWASINNAVLVCLSCAGIHRGLGVSVSYIRSLAMDDWDKRQIKLLQIGGNKNFNENLASFGIDSKIDTEEKYLLVASDYYRNKLQCELNGDDLPTRPNLEEAQEKMSSNQKVEYPTFGDSEDIKIEQKYKQIEGPKEVEKTGLMGKFSGFFSSAGTKVKKTANEISDKVKKMEIKDKLKKTGDKTVQLAKNGGNFIASKSKQAYNSQFVQTIKTKTEYGVGKIVDKTKGLMSKDKGEKVSEGNNIEIHGIKEANNTNNLDDDRNEE